MYTTIKNRNRLIVLENTVGCYYHGGLFSSGGYPTLPTYIPDLNNEGNVLYALEQRVGSIKGQNNDPYILEYGKKFIDKLARPIMVSEIPTWKDWMDHYDGRTKRKLYEVAKKSGINKKNISHCKCFIKEEGYVKPKFPRGIFSYSDESKLVIGPIQYAMDKILFSNKYFVKGKDPKNYLTIMQQCLGDDKCMETDYSKFEKHHDVVSNKLLKYWQIKSLKNLPITNRYKKYVLGLFNNDNIMKFKNVKACLQGGLMSGAMWTSSSNSLLNLIFTSYLVLEAKYGKDAKDHIDEFRGLFEGDDGICVASNVNDNTIRRLGLDLKFEFGDHFTDLKFCGMTGPRNGEIITDPSKFLRNFYVISNRYKNSNNEKKTQMMKAKAMSLKYLFPNCPIVSVACDKLLEKGGFNFKTVSASHNRWGMDLLKKAVATDDWRIKADISIQSRLDMEKKFKFSVETQLYIEQCIREDKPCDLFLKKDDVKQLMLNYRRDNYRLYRKNIVLDGRFESLNNDRDHGCHRINPIIHRQLSKSARMA